MSINLRFFCLFLLSGVNLSATVYAQEPVTANTASNPLEQMFHQLESRGQFDKIRHNLVLSCYVKGRNAPSAQMTLEQLDQEFPDRKAACQCFKRELDKVSNRTIFVDSYRSNQLRKAVEMARRQGDGRQLQQMQQQMKSYQTFMQSILTSCR